MFRLNIGSQQELVFRSREGLTLETTIELKDGYKVKTSNIANFIPADIRRVKVDNSGTIVPSVKFTLKFTKGELSGPFTVPLDGLEAMDWFATDPRCLLNPTFPKSKECLAYVIHSEYSKAPEESEYHIARLGTHIVEGVPVFCAGDRLIWPSGIESKPLYNWKPLPNIRLAVDPNYSEEQAVLGMMKLISLSPEAGRIIFSLNMMCVQWEAFAMTDIIPHSIVYPHGATGFKKTTYARFMTQIYNRDVKLESLTRFDASIPAAVELLYEKSDCVFVLDDLFPAKSNDINRQQEKTLLELTRIIADSIEPARMRGKLVANRSPRRAGLYTGEIYIETGAGSDDARLFPVKITIPVDKIGLTECQEEPLLLSTFYNFYIEWYITNFNEVVAWLKKWKVAYRSTLTAMHDRLQETQFCLEAAYKLYLTYCIEKGFITEETAREQYNLFYQQVRAIVKEQNDRINRSKSIKADIDYLALIHQMYVQRRFDLVESIKDFEIKEHDGIVHKGHLYLRLDKLMKKVRLSEPTANSIDVLKNLVSRGALWEGKGCKSRQLHERKRRRSIRFYAIKLDVLK